jgi:hypothetical protein
MYGPFWRRRANEKFRPHLGTVKTRIELGGIAGKFGCELVLLQRS